VLKLSKHINSECLGTALSWPVQASQERDHGSFSSPVMPQQHKYLARVHLYVDSSDGMRAIGITLAQISDLDALLCALQHGNFVRNPLISPRTHMNSLEHPITLFQHCRIPHLLPHSHILERPPAGLTRLLPPPLLLQIYSCYRPKN
jgi:hypothetical protein